MTVLLTGGVGFIGSHTAAELLGWRAEKSLEDMCRDAWRWQQSEWAK